MDAYRRQVGVTYPSESTCTVSWALQVEPRAARSFAKTTWKRDTKCGPQEDEEQKKDTLHIETITYTPWKINMEPENEPLEDYFPLQRRVFQVPC